MQVVMFSSFGERYLSTALFESLTKEAQEQGFEPWKEMVRWAAGWLQSAGAAAATGQAVWGRRQQHCERSVDPQRPCAELECLSDPSAPSGRRPAQVPFHL